MKRKIYLLVSLFIFACVSFAFSAGIEQEPPYEKPKTEKTLADVKAADDLESLGELYEYEDDYEVKTAYREKKTKLFLDSYKKGTLQADKIHILRPVKVAFKVEDPDDPMLHEKYEYGVFNKLIIIIYKDLFLMSSQKKKVVAAGLWDKRKLEKYSFSRRGIIKKKNENLVNKAPTKMWPVKVDIPAVHMVVIKDDIPKIGEFLKSNVIGIDIHWDTNRNRIHYIDFDFPKQIKEDTFTELDADIFF